MGNVTEKDTAVAAQEPLESAGQHSVFLGDKQRSGNARCEQCCGETDGCDNVQSAPHRRADASEADKGSRYEGGHKIISIQSAALL